MRRLLVPLLVCAALGACSRNGNHPNEAVSPDGRFAVGYKWQSGAIKEGEFQTLDLTVITAPRDCREAGISIAVNARMPGHGHGLSYQPVATMVSPLQYQVKGLMFQMGGAWEMYFDLSCLGTTTRLVVPLPVS